jgi:hypothetical protein
LGEHLLCKQGVIGSIPISSTKNSSFTVSRSLSSLWMMPIWKQAKASAGFYRLRAGSLDNNKVGWMFDNEIDWVMRI